jgi:hypothetical protein
MLFQAARFGVMGIRAGMTAIQTACAAGAAGAVAGAGAGYLLGRSNRRASDVAELGSVVAGANDAEKEKISVQVNMDLFRTVTGRFAGAHPKGVARGHDTISLALRDFRVKYNNATLNVALLALWASSTALEALTENPSVAIIEGIVKNDLKAGSDVTKAEDFILESEKNNPEVKAVMEAHRACMSRCFTDGQKVMAVK